jgi:hypothetical protein
MPKDPRIENLRETDIAIGKSLDPESLAKLSKILVEVEKVETNDSGEDLPPTQSGDQE